MTSTVRELLTHLDRLNVRLRVEQNSLRFSAPKGVLTDELRTRLRESKPEIMAHLGPGQSAPLPPPTRSHSEEPPPLTFAQEQIWLVEQLEPGTSAHNLTISIEIEGSLDVAVLRASLDAILQRHAPLRTTFESLGGEPRAHVHSGPVSVPFETMDLSHLPRAESTESCRAMVSEEGLRPFELSRDVLIRTRLTRQSDSEQTLIVTMHHIGSDGTSLVVFFDELTDTYARLADGETGGAPALEVEYVDYARWQREWMTGEALEHLIGHWTGRMGVMLPVLDLPADRPRPALATVRGGSTTTTLPAAAVASLRELAAEEQTTLFVPVLAAFQALLHRHTGADDIIVGVPVMGRDHPATQRLIGMFVNTLAMRTDVSGDPSFRELVRQVRRTSLEAFAHQALPFEKLVEVLNPKRDASRNPVFQVMLNVFLADTTPPEVSAGEATFRLMASPRLLAGAEVASKFDMTAYVTQGGAGALDLTFVYNADLFDAERMETFADTFRTLLAGAAADPDSEIGDLGLVSASVRERIDARRTAALPSGDFEPVGSLDPARTICSRFSEVVRRHGARPAVRTERCSRSYTELSDAARAVASALKAKGYASGDRIGLLVDDGFSRLASMLGILECGAAYVPLDPSYPPERLSYMVADSQARVVVTDVANEALASCLGAAEVLLCTNLMQSGISGEPRVVAPEDVAYVLYTSGSTGRPKGVVQNHRNVLRHIESYAAALHIDTSDSLSLLSSFGFDAAVMDTFGALLNGATLCTFDLRLEGVQGLASRLTAEGITVFHATPTVFREFAAGTSDAMHPCVRAVVLGGEPVRRSDFDLFQARFVGDARLVNLYGSAEHSLTCLGFVRGDALPKGFTINAGIPVAGAEVVLLRPDGSVSAVAGEIAVRGGAVALGYWNRADETAKTFPDRDGERWYRTGDLARRGPDGTLEYLGRSDRQVKVMGHRIEPGEVEAVLASHPSVRQSAIVVRDERLVGYAVYELGLEPTVSEVRTFLRERLPPYMVPGMIVAMDRFPVSANKKIDADALPDPFGPSSNGSGGYVPPATELERLVSDVWAELLGLERVSTEANFFELGGHSLLAVRAVSLIEDRVGRPVDPRTMFFMNLGQIAANLADHAGRP